MTYNISEVRYAAGKPQVMITCVCQGPLLKYPVCVLMCKVGSTHAKAQFLLPIGFNKFCKKASLPKEAIESYYRDYTHSANKNYY